MIDEEEEYQLDEITGRKSKRPVMSMLNKSKKISKHELDDLFQQLEPKDTVH